MDDESLRPNIPRFNDQKMTSINNAQHRRRDTLHINQVNTLFLNGVISEARRWIPRHFTGMTASGFMSVITRLQEHIERFLGPGLRDIGRQTGRDFNFSIAFQRKRRDLSEKQYCEIGHRCHDAGNIRFGLISERRGYRLCGQRTNRHDIRR